MKKAFVSIGSNIDKERNVANCIKTLHRTFGALILSPVYESKPVGFVGDNFYNMVVAFDTILSPQKIHTLLRQIEHKYQRIRGGDKFVSRTLDLDQLLHDNLVIESGQLKLPSEEITRYMHVLYPLADIAGSLCHPILGKTYRELRNKLNPLITPVNIIPFEAIEKRTSLPARDTA